MVKYQCGSHLKVKKGLIFHHGISIGDDYIVDLVNFDGTSFFAGSNSQNLASVALGSVSASQLVLLCKSLWAAVPALFAKLKGSNSIKSLYKSTNKFKIAKDYMDRINLMDTRKFSRKHLTIKIPANLENLLNKLAPVLAEFVVLSQKQILHQIVTDLGIIVGKKILYAVFGEDGEILGRLIGQVLGTELGLMMGQIVEKIDRTSFGDID